MSKAELMAMLSPYQQEHLLAFWDELNVSEQEALAADIKAVDWGAATSWYKQVQQGVAGGVPFERLTPAPYQPLQPKPGQEQLYADAVKTGENLLRAGKVAAFTVAGGQGSRLGYDGPKGTFCFSSLKNKSLFQYFAETLQGYQKKYQVIIPWYIMTSPANNEATVSFFQENKFFGLSRDNVMFFVQGTLPVFGLDGKALLSAKCHVNLAANGHGGSFAALNDSGALADMKKRGCDIITYWQVDNPMVRFCDPLFIGMHALSCSEMSSRALIKVNAAEKLGNFCVLDGKTTIVEYSDMPKEMLESQEADGQLVYRAGSPAIHIISRDFVERLTNGSLNMLPHRAFKKVACLDAAGEAFVPQEPNAIKLEFFLFDALPMAKIALILEGDRYEQFAPIKNAQGQDSAESCRQLLLQRDARWLSGAGWKIARKADGNPDCLIEISPLRAVAAEDLQALTPRQVLPGEKIYLD